MGKEIVTVTIEIDSDLMERLRAIGMDPVEYVQRLARRDAVLQEMKRLPTPPLHRAGTYAVAAYSTSLEDDPWN